MLIYYRSLYQRLDLHGETEAMSKFLINEIIENCYNNNFKYIAIIHGSGEVLKPLVLNMLKKDKRVKTYNVDIYNPGQTLLEIDN